METPYKELKSIESKSGQNPPKSKNMKKIGKFIPKQIFGLFGGLEKKETVAEKEERNFILKGVEKSLSLCRQLSTKKKEIIEVNKKLGEQRKAKRVIKYAFVTFKTKEIRNFFFDILPKSRFQGWFSCFDTLNMEIDEKVVVVSNPPDPINVNWLNISTSQKKRILKRIASFMFFALLFAIRKLSKT